MSSEFIIEVGPLEYERGNDPLSGNRLLGIQGTVRILVRGREWFNQPMFPVVELAAAVSVWLRRGGDFEFDTMEAAESPFFWVRLISDGCQIGAAWEMFPIEKPVPFGVAQRAFEHFASEIPKAARVQLGIDVSDLVGPAG